MELDPKIATRVYGSSRAAWFQNGQYFDGAGEPIGFEEAGLPAVGDVAPVVKAEPPVVVNMAPPPPPSPEYVAVVDAPVARAPGEKTWGDDRLLKLKPLSSTVLAAMVMKAGGTPSTGMGAKKKNIAWLLENVKD